MAHNKKIKTVIIEDYKFRIKVEENYISVIISKNDIVVDTYLGNKKVLDTIYTEL